MLMLFSKRHMFKALEQYDMTPVQGTLLIFFEPNKTYPMQELSRVMGCDASNITGLVDRLEKQNMLIRTTSDEDRRVKRIMLTNQGQACRQSILQSLADAEAADLQRLTQEEQEIFTRLIDKLTYDIS